MVALGLSGEYSSSWICVLHHVAIDENLKITKSFKGGVE